METLKFLSHVWRRNAASTIFLRNCRDRGNGPEVVPQDSGVSWSSTRFCSTVRIPAFCPKHWIYCILFFTMLKKNGCDKHFLFNHIHPLHFETSLFLSETPYLSLFSTELCICIFHKSKITSERSTNPSSNPSEIFASSNTHS